MNGFGGIGSSKSVDTVYKKEGKRVLETALLTVCAGKVELVVGKAKCPGVCRVLEGQEKVLGG